MNCPFKILYEDNHLIAVDKPSGLLTQPTDLVNESLETALKEWIKKEYNKPGNVFLSVVHRLDRPVSGIVLCAKTSKALSRLNASIREKKFHKIYQALVEGHPPKKQGTLEHFLRHDDYRAYICQANDPDAKLARLHYEVVKQTETTSLLQIILETGRYHQIRLQCSVMGCPIVGDSKYGSFLPFSNGIALHHTRLEFEHPVTKAHLIIESSPLFQ